MAGRFAWLRLPSQLLHALWAIEEALRSSQRQALAEEALTQRIEALERSRALWEAEMEAARVKLDSQFKATRAAEERIRNARRRMEDEEDEEADVEPGAFTAPEGYAPGAVYAQPSAGEAVPAVHSRLADRDAARARKWGRA